MTPIREAWTSVWRRRDLRPIPEWARENTDLRPPLTKTGPFDVSGSRHFIEPLAALQHDRVREVNILKPLRSGGTLIADIWCPWTRENDPGPFMFLLQTDSIADDHFTKVLLPTMRSVPSIRAELDSMDRFKKTGRKLEFSDGNHFHINGPSIGNLQTNAFRYIVEDECWLYPDKMIDAEGRLGDFQKQRLSKVLRVSQGGPAPGVELSNCAWHRAFNRGEIHEWEVACPACGKYYEPLFTGTRDDGSYWGITWDQIKLPNGDWNIKKCKDTVRFECPHCAGPVIDGARTKSEWNRTGRYKVVGDRDTHAKSFRWEAVIDFPWVDLVELWLDACNAFNRGDIQPKIQFYQKRRAMFKDEESLMRGGLSFKRTTYEINSEWSEERSRYLSIDRQDEDVFWVTVRAWSRERSRRLFFGKAYGFAECESIRQKFKVSPNHTFIDSAFVPKGDHGVYAACIKYGWIAVRGDDKHAFVHKGVIIRGKPHDVVKSYSHAIRADPEIGTSGQGRKFANLILFSKPQMNQLVQGLIDSGRWEEPVTGDEEMEKEYNAQMSARRKKTVYNSKTNQPEVVWYEGKNDHARDVANMQAFGAVVEGLIPDPASERLANSEVSDHKETVEVNVEPGPTVTTIEPPTVVRILPITQ